MYSFSVFYVLKKKDRRYWVFSWRSNCPKKLTNFTQSKQKSVFLFMKS